MCGRFYVDDETEKEIEKIVYGVEKSINKNEKRDIYPSQNAKVICSCNHKMSINYMKWGFEINGRRIINARREGLFAKRMFANQIKECRCVIAAKGFYEWDYDKNKITFERLDKKVIFLAGLYKIGSNEEQFVIITTNANQSMKPVHDRMPLILEETEVNNWLNDRSVVKSILNKVPSELIMTDGYFQQNMFKNRFVL